MYACAEKFIRMKGIINHIIAPTHAGRQRLAAALHQNRMEKQGASTAWASENLFGSGRNNVILLGGCHNI